MSQDRTHNGNNGNNEQIEMNSSVMLSLEEKAYVVQYVLTELCINVNDLRQMCTRHNISRATSSLTEKLAAELRSDFNFHECNDACIVLASEAVQAGFGIRSGKRRAPLCSDPPSKRICTSVETEFASDFPVILPQSEKDQLLHEFRRATDKEAMSFLECSFCGKYEPAGCATKRPVTSLDITFLEKAVEEIRVQSRQPHIQCFKHSSVVNGCYVLCHLCESSVSKNRFRSLPVRSYANGLWIGDIPDELQGLTFLEEQCIGRARATKCMYKLSMKPDGQLAARGNVCILPQDTSLFLSAMPPPISTLQDEICVILVGSAEKAVTYDMLKKTPLLVRRSKIGDALLWLINNNPLYADLDKGKTLQNLEEYPEYDCPLAIQQFMHTNSANNQGSSYTRYSEEANTELLADNTGDFELASSTLVDVDNIHTTYRQQKLEALRMLKANTSPFVKFPSGNTPLCTSGDSRVFGWLWPILFPYGVGTIDNDGIRRSPNFRFHKVPTATHVSHLLTIADRRFQTHKSFIFVMHNIISRRRSSFNSRLAVPRSWFPLVQQLLEKVDDASMLSYQKKLNSNHGPFPHAETEGEKAAVRLMKYLSYISDHITGSVGDVNTMRQQIRSKIVSHGLPHFFATVNPAVRDSFGVLSLGSVGFVKRSAQRVRNARN
jgi:hypothetical protein